MNVSLCFPARLLCTLMFHQCSQMSCCTVNTLTLWTPVIPQMCSGIIQIHFEKSFSPLHPVVLTKPYLMLNEHLCIVLQICAGAVQRPVMADLWSSNSGPALLSACALCCAQPNVQLHHEHALTKGVLHDRCLLDSPNRPHTDTTSLHCRHRPPRCGHGWTNQPIIQRTYGNARLPSLCQVSISHRLEDEELVHHELASQFKAWACSSGRVLSSRWNACIYLIYCNFLNVSFLNLLYYINTGGRVLPWPPWNENGLSCMYLS